jgi:hypothetical protein
MRAHPAILAALVAVSCGTRPTGLLSQDLDSVRVAVGERGPARIEGVPGRGMSPLEIVELASSDGVESLVLHCPGADSALAAEVLARNPGLPGTVQVADTYLLVTSLSGLTWRPRYTAVVEAGILQLEANVILSNSTGETWRTVCVRITDSDGLVLATTSGGLTLPPGDTVIPWWRTVGSDAGTTISYGSPVPAAWSALRAFHAPGAGPVLERMPGPVIRMIGADTVWIAEDRLEIDHESLQNPQGYDMTTTVRNVSSATVSARVACPTLLESGAVFSTDAPPVLTLQPGDEVLISSTIRYPRRG